MRKSIVFKRDQCQLCWLYMDNNHTNTSVCPQCGVQLPNEAIYCFQCGAKVVKASNEKIKVPLENSKTQLAHKECPKCGTNLPLSALFCAECGEKLMPAEVSGQDMPHSEKVQEKESASKLGNTPVVSSATTIDEPSEVHKECPKCGTNLPLNALFCAECGEKLMPAKVSGQDMPHSEKTPEKEPVSESDNAPVTTLENTINEPSEEFIKECPKCGKNLPLDALFCAKCGERLEPPEAPGQEMSQSEDGQEKESISKHDNVSDVASTNTIDEPSISRKECPKCGTNLPLDARFCAKCGMHFLTKQYPEENNLYSDDITETKHIVNTQAKMANSELTGMPTITIENKAFNICEENLSSDKLEQQNKQSENRDIQQTSMYPKKKHRTFYIVFMFFLIITIYLMTYWFYYRSHLNLCTNADTVNILKTERRQTEGNKQAEKREVNEGDNELVEPIRQTEPAIVHDDKTEIAVVSQTKEDVKEQKAETNGGDNEIIEPQWQAEKAIVHDDKTEIAVVTQHQEEAQEQKIETNVGDDEPIEPPKQTEITIVQDDKVEIVTVQQPKETKEQKEETEEDNNKIIEPSQQAKGQSKEDDQDKIEEKEINANNHELPNQEDTTISQDDRTEVTTVQIQQIPNIIPINTENSTENDAVSKFQYKENEAENRRKDEQTVDDSQAEKSIPQLSYIDSLIKKADDGDVNAAFELGSIYELGKEKKQNFEQSFRWYSVAAKRGMSNAQVKVGDMYLNGIGIEKNQKNAVEWYRKAANKDNAQGLYSLGICYEKGLGLSINYNEAIKLYNEAILLGSLDAQYQLAQCYFKGHGVRKDNRNALDKLKKAASKGHVKSQLAIGKCYSEGKGVVQDAKTAVIWYQKAAEKGDAEGQMQLALCYEKGKGVKQNSVIAVEWAEKAAAQGFTAAEYFLGNAYQNGRGVPQNSDIATLWYRKAANKGVHNAANALQMLE